MGITQPANPDTDKLLHLFCNVGAETIPTRQSKCEETLQSTLKTTDLFVYL